MVTTNDRRRMLRAAWEAAPEGEGTLLPQLLAHLAAASNLISGGAVSSISKNQNSHSFAGGGSGNITQTDNANTLEELVTLFENIQTAFASAGLATDDQTIKDEMMRRLVPCREFTKDFTHLACA